MKISEKNYPRGLRLLIFAVAAMLVNSALALEVTVLDGTGQPLANAVVTVSVPFDKKTAPGKLTVVEQRGQQFKPQVTVISPGTAVRFPNRDLTQHHVYSFSRAKAFEIELYGGEEPSPVIMDEPGIVAMGCNIHDWMLGYVYVSPDPIYGVTDATGAVQLSAVLTAIQSMSVWHPGILGEGPVVITETDRWRDGAVEVTIALPQGNPLKVAEDPLQALFRSSAE